MKANDAQHDQVTPDRAVATDRPAGARRPGTYQARIDASPRVLAQRRFIQTLFGDEARTGDASSRGDTGPGVSTSKNLGVATVAQRVATFQDQNGNVDLDRLAQWVQEQFEWLELLSETQIVRMLEEFAERGNGVYQVSENDCSAIETDLYEYWFGEDDQTDGDLYDEVPREKVRKKKDKHRRKDLRELRATSERDAEREGLENVLKKLGEGEGGEDFEDVPGLFKERFAIALQQMSTAGKLEKQPRYVEALGYGPKGRLTCSNGFKNGKPGDASSVYGLVPTERGDFTKLQYAILNDVVYGSGVVSVLVEWESQDGDANAAQIAKIKSLLGTLSRFGHRTGSLLFCLTPLRVDAFDDLTMMAHLLGGGQTPVLSGGEASDKMVYDKGAAFWRKNSKAMNSEGVGRERIGKPFLVIWFNRSDVEVDDYSLDEDSGKKGQHLREMRHKTNVGTMARIVDRYKGDKRVIFAGNRGAKHRDIDLSPYLDLRESWKLPGHKSLLSQDRTFDELAALSGQEVLHIGFRSGRLESLVMQPRQRVIMLENNISEIGNARAAKYYAYSQRGSVFRPPGLAALNTHPDTLAYANRLKEEEVEASDPQRYGLPRYLPKPMTGQVPASDYEEYLAKLDRLMKKQRAPELSGFAGELADRLQRNLPDRLLDVATWPAEKERKGAAVARLKEDFKTLFDGAREQIVAGIQEYVLMPRETEIRRAGMLILTILIEHANKVLKEEDRTRMIGCLEALRGLVVQGMLLKGLANIRALEAMIPRQ